MTPKRPKVVNIARRRPKREAKIIDIITARCRKAMDFVKFIDAHDGLARADARGSFSPARCCTARHGVGATPKPRAENHRIAHELRPPLALRDVGEAEPAALPLHAYG